MKPLVLSSPRTTAVALSSVAASVLVWVGAAVGAPTEQASLNACQQAVQRAAATFVTGEIAAVGACLQAISREVIAKSIAAPNGGAAACVRQFRALSDTRGLGRSLPEKLRAAITTACDPSANSALTHTLGDVLGPGASVFQPLDADNIASWCATFGGPGRIDSVPAWLNCIQQSQECAVDTAISTQYPRALEYLRLVQFGINKLTPPPNDPTQLSDALAGISRVRASVQGSGTDEMPHFSCGNSGNSGGDTCGNGLKGGSEQCDSRDLGGATCASLGFAGGTLACSPKCAFDVTGCNNCGDGVRQAGEQCDGSDLGGASCLSLGFAGGTLACDGNCGLEMSGCTVSCGTCGNGVRDGFEPCDGSDLGGASCESLGFAGGTLACTAGCTFDVRGCHAAVFPASGQVSANVTNDDGYLKAGGALSYTDNGDGTITDNNTGLMWEKKVMLNSTANGASPHDADNCYVWAGKCSGSGAWCGVDTDCPGGHTCVASSPGDPTGCFVGATIFQWVAGLNAANFAGHSDWRIPNVKELQSIVSYERFNRSVAPAFDGAGCGGACADMTSAACSCTGITYWSSTTYSGASDRAWNVEFIDGAVSSYAKAWGFHVRAVRGGA